MLDLTTAAYFADMGIVLASGRGKISITAYSPKKLPYSLDGRMGLLAPPSLLFHASRAGTLSDDEFDDRYIEQLNSLGAKLIERNLERLTDKIGNEKLVLLCYEDVSKGLACHRRTFAEWWEKETGQAVPELSETIGQLSF